MTKQVGLSTFIEFSRTLLDEKAGFTFTLFIQIGESGIVLGSEYGTSDDHSCSSNRGQINISSLKKLLVACRDMEHDGVSIDIAMGDYDADERTLETRTEGLEIPLAEPLDFRPFLQ